MAENKKNKHSVPEPWKQLLAAASTMEELTALANEFADRIEPADRAALPVECRPPHFATARDINGYAYQLATYHGLDIAIVEGTIRRLSVFYNEAAARAAYILGPGREHQQLWRESV